MGTPIAVTPESEEGNNHRDRRENEHQPQRHSHRCVRHHCVEIGAGGSKPAEYGNHGGHHRDRDDDQRGDRQRAVAVAPARSSGETRSERRFRRGFPRAPWAGSARIHAEAYTGMRSSTRRSCGTDLRGSSRRPAKTPSGVPSRGTRRKSPRNSGRRCINAAGAGLPGPVDYWVAPRRSSTGDASEHCADSHSDSCQVSLAQDISRHDFSGGEHIGRGLSVFKDYLAAAIHLEAEISEGNARPQRVAEERRRIQLQRPVRFIRAETARTAVVEARVIERTLHDAPVELVHGDVQRVRAHVE